MTVEHAAPRSTDHEAGHCGAHRAHGERESHLFRTAVREFVDNYHNEPPHQGLGNELIAPATTVIGSGQIQCLERLGGLLKFYHRQAA